MMRFGMLSLLILSFSVAACVNTATKGGKNQEEGMAQFANDPEFKEKHDGPTEATPTGAGEMIRFATPDGKDAGAYALMAENANKYLIVVHEWWGLNDNIKAEAEHYFKSLEGVNVLAIDIYDGKVATNPDDAGKYMQGVAEDRAKAIVQGALTKAGAEAEIATIGWCFGGGWSLKTSIMAGDRAAGCVMYYGMPVQTVDALKPLQTDILGIFATQDQWINPDVVSNFKKIADEAGKDLQIHNFDAGHAFANPSNPKFDEEAAKKANQLALDFLKKRLS